MKGADDIGGAAIMASMSYEQCCEFCWHAHTSYTFYFSMSPTCCANVPCQQQDDRCYGCRNRSFPGHLAAVCNGDLLHKSLCSTMKHQHNNISIRSVLING